MNPTLRLSMKIKLALCLVVCSMMGTSALSQTKPNLPDNDEVKKVIRPPKKAPPIDTKFYGAGGHGGGVVNKPGQDPEPADLHYMPENFTLPSSYIKFTLDQYPGLKEELLKIANILRERSQVLTLCRGDRSVCGNVRWLDNGPSTVFYDTDIEFYFTPVFSGADKFSVVQGWTYEQIGFTYEFREVAQDFSKTTMREIVEIRKDLFDILPRRYQALVIAHELLHHSKLKSHALISPILKGVERILAIEEIQNQSPYELTPDELLTVKTAYQALGSLGDRKRGYFALSKAGGFIIAPASTDSVRLEKMAGENEIDITSNVEIFNSIPDGFKYNSLKNTQVIFDNLEPFKGKVSIQGNTFESSNIKFEYPEMGVNLTGNHFAHSIAAIGAYRLATNIVDNDIKDSIVDLDGDIKRNKFKDSYARINGNSCSDNAFSAVRGALNCQGQHNFITEICKLAPCSNHADDFARFPQKPLDANDNRSGSNVKFGSFNRVSHIYCNGAQCDIDMGDNNRLEVLIPFQRQGYTYRPVDFQLKMKDHNSIIRLETPVLQTHDIEYQYLEMNSGNRIFNSNIMSLHASIPVDIRNSSIVSGPIRAGAPATGLTIQGLNIDAPNVELDAATGNTVLLFDLNEKLQPPHLETPGTIKLGSVRQVKDDLKSLP